MPTSTCAGEASTCGSPVSRTGARVGAGIAGEATHGVQSRSGTWAQVSGTPTMSGWNVGRGAAQSVCTMRLRVPHMKSDEIAYI